MSIRVAINGFGRMGRLALRACWGWPELDIVLINDVAADAATAAHLLNFDSQHGRWAHQAEASQDGSAIKVADKQIQYYQQRNIADLPLAENKVDIVVECTGVHKTTPALQPYFAQGIKKVVVSAPVKDGPLNIVMGVNDHLYDPQQNHIVTAASCTTNCLAPVVKVIHEQLGIVHGSMTTIHDITNTQSILDTPHKDLRRARASGMSLIPTSTGSASAIALIFPELQGKLNGIAVRVPLTNSSLTDCVFEVSRDTDITEVNRVLKEASETYLAGVLGYEERPLVSIDYVDDIRSGIVDAPSTMVINKRQVKLLVWYDNEIGYVNRMMELTKKVAAQL
ncbi:ArsJ-associated glyceraldehyde-3-phosphate dehydrogenase [Aliamphritea spongicola]|uniref:ArsJ-associated glyceraldehyde-3-phosphate dehydrogenase n=1 Tax=Aliamphritea spongicola TaxID=707589 RepID=UPI00196A9018|nr:ArsJ-associated glyceraldehyde-3-phosphate dehydrogenase [Aliamphritea spongicola]MBN3564413.1 ArsJ-associated glyceraldehyde-3-phosphate dehydrogenase [Aliamphritea spongicola]